MRLRAPSYPLITVDPYFSVWSPANSLTDTDTEHWTAAPVVINGIATVDGKDYRIIGKHSDAPAAKQLSVNVDCFSTTYKMECGGVVLTLRFTTPLILDDLYYLSRPVSYLEITRENADRHMHTVSVKLAVSEQICTHLQGDAEILTEQLTLGSLSSVKMYRKDQAVLCRMGDDLRIEWGYFYLTGNGRAYSEKAEDGMTYACFETPLSGSTLVTFAYDDVKCIEYFGEHLTSYWNKDGAAITDEIVKAHGDYRQLVKRCAQISDRVFIDAVRAGGEKYAELLELSFRQAAGAHKVAVDTDGQILFISKECFSNGCAATVDVSYPSIPLFLLYNTELVKGMMRPIYKFAMGPDWNYDFAPHDAGRYPILNGQEYGNTKPGGKSREFDYRYDKQMPVEECGNMLMMETAVAVIDKSPAFANEHMELLDKWVEYLLQNGTDPENQLCTDDFAGHLAHNCNLTLKAIMGIAGYGILKGMNGDNRAKNKYIAIARGMAKDWVKRASNGDGSYRLAFDRPGTFSMKYNIVWDKLMGTNIFPKDFIESEIASYMHRMLPFGLPLDNRQPYTKSDWLVWVATLADRREDFERLVEPLWNFFNYTPSRVPMTDWYWCHTGLHKAYFSKTSNKDISFRNRTVQGGLFMKLLEYRGLMKL
ncbi:MAG: DUF4965 domain-containing protein [Clostridia bacterium]|nr:DUF4965 domain-containing protein [Clostridia bacterium]